MVFIEILALAIIIMVPLLVINLVMYLFQRYKDGFFEEKYRRSKGFLHVNMYEVFLPEHVYADLVNEMGLEDEPMFDKKMIYKCRMKNRKAIIEKLTQELNQDQNSFVHTYVDMFYEGDEAKEYLSDFINQYMIKWYPKTSVALPFNRSWGKRDYDYPFGQWFRFYSNDNFAFDIPISKVKLLVGTTKDWTIILENNLAYNFKGKKVHIRNVPDDISDANSVMSYLLFSSDNE